MDLASRVLTYALIPLAIGLTFRWLAKRFPVPQSTTEPSPQTRPARPKGHTAYALSVVLGGTAVAIAASYALAGLGARRLARKLAEHTGASVRLGGAMPRRDQ